jgi:hypothetical protein
MLVKSMSDAAFSGIPSVYCLLSMTLGPPGSLADGEPGYAHRNQTFMHDCVFYANVIFALKIYHQTEN